MVILIDREEQTWQERLDRELSICYVCTRSMTSRNVALILMMIDRQQQMEQERLDRELALRLAAEDQSQVEEVTREPLNRCVFRGCAHAPCDAHVAVRLCYESACSK